MSDDRRPEETNRAPQDAHDDAWVERVREVWAPDEMTPAERHAFDVRLETRIESNARRGFAGRPLWQPIAAVAVAAIALWLVWGSALTPEGTEAKLRDRIAGHRPASLAAWEREILAAAEDDAEAGASTDATILPDDYRAISGLFLEGGDAIAHGR